MSEGVLNLTISAAEAGRPLAEIIRARLGPDAEMPLARGGVWLNGRRLADAERLLSRIGIRNIWAEDLAVGLSALGDYAELSLVGLWARAAWNRRADPALAYSELYRALELLLRACASQDPASRERRTKHLPGPQLYARACAGVPALKVALSSSEFDQLRVARNLLIHESGVRDAAGHPMDWPPLVKRLANALRRAEGVAPEPVIEELVATFDPFVARD